MENESKFCAYVIGSYPAVFLCILWAIWIDSIWYHEFKSVNLALCALTLISSPLSLIIILPSCVLMTGGVVVSWSYNAGILVPCLCALMGAMAAVAVSLLFVPITEDISPCKARSNIALAEEALARDRKAKEEFEKSLMEEAEESKNTTSKI